MAKYTDLQVIHDGWRGCVRWNAGGKRYHIWLNKDDTPEFELHQNTVTGKYSDGRDITDHRSLDSTNKTNAAMLALVFAEVKGGDMIAKAKAEQQVQQAAHEAELGRQHALHVATEAMNAEVRALALRGGFQDVRGLELLHELAERVRALQSKGEG